MDVQAHLHMQFGLEIETDAIIPLMLIIWIMVKKELGFAKDGMSLLTFYKIWANVLKALGL